MKIIYQLKTKSLFLITLCILTFLSFGSIASAADPQNTFDIQPMPDITENQLTSLKVTSLPSIDDLLTVVDKAASEGDSSKDWSTPIKLVIVFSGLAILPSLMIMMTSFTRIVIVLAFVRRALSTQTIPPTIALIGLAMFLTIFTMAPTFSQINEIAIAPYIAGEIDFEIASQNALDGMKDFMLRQLRPDDLAMFMDMANIEPPESPTDLPIHIVIPSFAISEFRTAFEIGALLFIPFLVIDLVVSSILLSAGMMMLPPVMISMPFKIILFILVDGWHLLAKSLSMSFTQF